MRKSIKYIIKNAESERDAICQIASERHLTFADASVYYNLHKD